MTIMAALTPRARALVQAGRDGFRPEDADRTRIESALQARLGTDALPPDAPDAGGPSAAPPAAAGGWLAPGLAVGICVLAGAGIFATRWAGSDTGSAAAPSAPAPVAVIAAPPAQPASLSSNSVPAVTTPALEGEPVAAPAPPEARAPAASPARDRLAEEVALLSRATSALRAGRPSDALKALDEHQHRFPSGALREERRAARAQALCASKHVSEGRAELARLAPGSPAAVRAQQVCDANAAASKER
jgi:hypothetical protein